MLLHIPDVLTAEQVRDARRVLLSAEWVDGAEVLVETVQLRCARNGNDPRLLREQPRERDLSRRRLLAVRDRLQQVDDRLIRLACLW